MRGYLLGSLLALRDDLEDDAGGVAVRAVRRHNRQRNLIVVDAERSDRDYPDIHL